MAVSCSPILWQNEDQTITLIDIPRSICAAQGTEEYPCSDLILSTEPLTAPYSSSQEPKSAKAKENLKNNTVPEERHAVYRDILESALEQIRTHHDRDWCLARRFVVATDLTVKPTKRKLNEVDEPMQNEQVSKGFKSHLKPHDTIHNLCTPHSMLSKDEKKACSVCGDDDLSFQTNCSAKPLENQFLPEISHGRENDDHAFRMPPFSTYYIGDLGQEKSIRAFHDGVRNQASAHETARRFDLIVMDPPWPNRSVDRIGGENIGAGYATASSLKDIRKLILGMDLDALMANDALVGIWTTNKPAIYDLVLEEIFPQWGLRLEEEWIWLKTTVHGEPTIPIESLWRKPYEILLIGRKQRLGSTRSTRLSTGPKHRCIFAVPDFHSRKPCLKELIKPLLASHTNPRVLEVFARNLVAEWWSVGNECTQFNKERIWYKAEDASDWI